MRFRIYSAAITAFAVLALVSVSSAAAGPRLSKPAARKAAVASMNRFLASHHWADAGRVGICNRKARRRVLCKLIMRGPARSCVGWIDVALGTKVKPKARLANLRCGSDPLGVLHLRARLGVPKREVLDPFHVTYPQEADATLQKVSGSVEPIPATPGVLALYVDGRLECAENVNAANPATDCPVDYDALGTYRITSIYTSGSESAADSMLHAVEPLPSETHVSVTYESLPMTTNDFGCGEDSTCEQELDWHEDSLFNVGTLNVKASVAPWGAVPISACPSSDADCLDLELDDAGEAHLPVSAMADYLPLEEKSLAVGDTLALETEAVQNISLPGATQLPITKLQAGALHFLLRSGSRAGFIESETLAQVSFTPQITSPVERVACSC